MALHEIDDLSLPNFICGNPLVVVKFTAEDCPVCVELAPTFHQLSNQERYSGIKFVKMDAKKNPVASRKVEVTGGTPFMAIYRNGTLETCKMISNETELRDLLDRLLK